jgi:hypothetical protein
MLDKINVRTDPTLGQLTFSHMFEAPIESVFKPW